MPLSLRLKPGERLIVNGAVLRNGSPRAIELELLNHVTTLHERDLMLPEEADTPLRRLYFQVQMMHLEPEHQELHRRAAIDLAASIYAEALQEGGGPMTQTISEIIALIGERAYPTALRRLQKAIGKPGDVRVATAAPQHALAK
jgi:flagellar biosynthesis regulator FlbT